MKNIENFSLLISRLLLSGMFIYAGYGKIIAYSATAGYMDKMNVPSLLLPLVIITEFGGGLAILLGLGTRYVSIALAGFCLLAGYLFHYLSIDGTSAMTDSTNWIMFMKNITIAGGFLALSIVGAGKISIDNLIFSKKEKLD